LIEILKKLKPHFENLDFGKHVIPHLVKKEKISAFRFSSYWLDIGTLKGYYLASMELLTQKPRLNLYTDTIPVLTHTDDNPPLVVTKEARIRRSMICNGCVVKGDVSSSILSPGVKVERGARIENSIIFHDCTVRRGALLKNVIVDKMSVIGIGTKIGSGNSSHSNVLQPEYLDFGITLIGKKTKIPPGINIGTNCLVCGSQRDGSIPKRDIEDGGYYIAKDVYL
jgi:glucose-1-phosphate adenylyltransferase